MNSPDEEKNAMIDIAFDISGDSLPANYHFELWEELINLLPQLAEHEKVGIVPLRLSESNERMLLPKRAKLVLRVPFGLADIASGLAHKELQLGGKPFQLGPCKTRAIQHYPTLHSHFVSGAADEVVFLSEVETELAAMGVKASIICGRHHTLSGHGHSISGFSLVLHDLTTLASLRVQYTGIGSERRFGCGIFLPHKVISSSE